MIQPQQQTEDLQLMVRSGSEALPWNYLSSISSKDCWEENPPSTHTPVLKPYETTNTVKLKQCKIMFWLVEGSVTANPWTILSGCNGHAAHVHEYDWMMLFRGQQNCDLSTPSAWMLLNLLEKAGSISCCCIGLHHRSCRPEINKRNRDLSVLCVLRSTIKDRTCAVQLQETAMWEPNKRWRI